MSRPEWMRPTEYNDPEEIGDDTPAHEGNGSPDRYPIEVDEDEFYEEEDDDENPDFDPDAIDDEFDDEDGEDRRSRDDFRSLDDEPLDYSRGPHSEPFDEGDEEYDD